MKGLYKVTLLITMAVVTWKVWKIEGIVRKIIICQNLQFVQHDLQLYQNINNDVNTMAGIKTRTQLRQKHFNDVMEIITNWFPSQSTMYVIRQLEMDFEEGNE